MEETFVQAACLQPPKILGQQLLPFSLWHNYVLKALNTPFAIGGTPDMDDIAMAVWICSHTYTEGARLLFGDIDSVTRDLQGWGSSPSNRTTDPEALIIQIEEYIREYLEVPEHWHEEKRDQPDKPLRGPWEWHCVLNLCTNHLARDKAEAWDCAVNEARCWYSIYAASQGDETLITDKDRADIEKAKQPKEDASHG